MLSLAYYLSDSSSLYGHSRIAVQALRFSVTLTSCRWMPGPLRILYTKLMTLFQQDVLSRLEEHAESQSGTDHNPDVIWLADWGISGPWALSPRQHGTASLSAGLPILQSIIDKSMGLCKRPSQPKVSPCARLQLTSIREVVSFRSSAPLKEQQILKRADEFGALEASPRQRGSAGGCASRAPSES